VQTLLQEEAKARWSRIGYKQRIMIIATLSYIVIITVMYRNYIISKG
jgi:hypothetical protein